VYWLWALRLLFPRAVGPFFLENFCRLFNWCAAVPLVVMTDSGAFTWASRFQFFRKASSSPSEPFPGRSSLFPISVSSPGNLLSSTPPKLLSFETGRSPLLSALDLHSLFLDLAPGTRFPPWIYVAPPFFLLLPISSATHQTLNWVVKTFWFRTRSSLPTIRKDCLSALLGTSHHPSFSCA